MIQFVHRRARGAQFVCSARAARRTESLRCARFHTVTVGGRRGANLALRVETMPVNAGPRVRPADTPAWRDFGGTPVRLTLAPDAGDVSLHGRLIRSLPGYFGVLRYLLELDE